MEIPNKGELQQIKFNLSSDITWKDFMSLYKKCSAKPYSSLVIETTLASDNSSSFRKNLFKKIHKLIMTIDDKIKDEQLLYDIDRKAGQTSALLSGIIDKYEYITGEEILSFAQSKIIE